MSQLGLGVMIQQIFGDNGASHDAIVAAIGRKITHVEMKDDTLRIGLDSGKTLALSDYGQSCCESRYMTCDDDLTGFYGAELVSIEVRDAPSQECTYGDQQGRHYCMYPQRAQRLLRRVRYLGKPRGDSVSDRIHFQCPTCNAEHDRGFVDGVCVFRCLCCGYQGHGFHPDPQIDCEVYADHLTGNAISRSLGLPETPLGVDPLSNGA